MNIVEMKDHFFTKGAHKEKYSNIVMEYLPTTVHRVIKHFNDVRQPMPLLLVKLYAFQMFKALAFIHSLGCCHRDIKPSNLLVDPNKAHTLKICDFGSVVRLLKGEKHSSYICSRYYRAPELIFGSTEYNTKIDIWSAGCVIVEMLIGQPIFPGESGVDQLVEIMKVLGSPDQAEVEKMNKNYVDVDFKFEVVPVHGWKPYMRKNMEKKELGETIDLLNQIFVWIPDQRIEPFKALMMPFFEELRDENTVLPNGDPLPDIFKFSPEDLNGLGDEEDGKGKDKPKQTLQPEWYLDKVREEEALKAEEEARKLRDYD